MVKGGCQMPAHWDVDDESFGGGSRRRVRPLWVALGAIAAVALVAAVTLAVMGAVDRDPVSAAASPPASPSVASSASPTPSPSVSPEPAVVSADGIDEYPPLAAPREGGFPEAYEMRDWVWDFVGEGWAVESYSLRDDPYLDPAPVIPHAVIYLVGPSGARFELQELDLKQSAGLRVVSWQEEARTVHIMWEGDYSEPVLADPGSAVLDLTSGLVDPIVFKTPWGSTGNVSPLAVSAAGNELWEARTSDHRRYYRYGGGDDWTVAAVSDLEVAGAASTPGWRLGGYGNYEQLTGVRTDGAAVLFEKGDWWAATGNALAATEIAVYDIDADSYVLSQPALNPTGTSTVVCNVTSWARDADLTYDCWGDDTPSTTVQVQAVGAPPAKPVPSSRRPMSGAGDALSAEVRYGEPTQLSYLWYLCGC